MKDVLSPDSYIKWGFYSMIACALQRRVWRGDLKHSAMFPNIYPILVGEPGIGKGRVTSAVEKVLTFHKKDQDKDLEALFKPEDPKEVSEILKGDVPLLFKKGPNTVTFESLIKSMSKGVSAVWYKKDPSSSVKDLYIHSSIYFTLEELSSLFRKHTDDLVRFLHQTYDCIETYENETIGRGKDRMQNTCLNMLAGTQASFLKKVFADDLLNEGFASRALFICEEHPRGRSAKAIYYTEDQFIKYKELLNHIKDLSKLFGEVKFTDEAQAFLEDWWMDEEMVTTNKNPKLKYYYARKLMTVVKLSMIIHFSNNLDYIVNISEVKQATEELLAVEAKMHLATMTSGANPLSDVTLEILKYIKKNGPQKSDELFFEFWNDLQDGIKSFDSIMTTLVKGNKIKKNAQFRYEIVIP